MTAPAPAQAVTDAGARPWYRNPELRLLVTGRLRNSVAFFATPPFLTLYLSDISTLSPALIGGVVGAVALIAAIGGFLGGVLTDRFGAVTLIRAGLVLLRRDLESILPLFLKAERGESAIAYFS